MNILETTMGSPILNIIIFAAFVVGTMTVVISVTRSGQKSAAQMYTGGAAFSGRQERPRDRG